MNEREKLKEAWENYILALGKSLRLDKFLNWVIKKLEKKKQQH
ncbi:hypothetical protein [Caloranaerobacter ferrireducens]|nr:hypothetical protein [Caloranaerobacter ferrireducens]